MKTLIMPRIFEVEIDYKDIKLPDPNPEWSVKEVMEHYANTYPELTNCSFNEPKIENDELIYKISSDKGQHG